MPCKEDFVKKCNSKPHTKDGNPWVATWNQTKKKCLCMIDKQTRDDKGKVIDTEVVDPAQTR